MSVRAHLCGAWDWLMNFIDQKNDDSSYEKCPSLIFRQKCKKDSKKKTGAYTEKNKSRKTRLQFIHIV